MLQGVDRIDAVLDRTMEELGNSDARAEVAQSIERSFQIFHLYDELSGRAGRQNLLTGARRIAAVITTLEDQLHAVIATLNTLENQLRTAEPLLVSYGFHPGLRYLGRSWMRSSTQPTHRYSHGGSRV
jgi:hypothetical protein